MEEMIQHFDDQIIFYQQIGLSIEYRRHHAVQSNIVKIKADLYLELMKIEIRHFVPLENIHTNDFQIIEIDLHRDILIKKHHFVDQ